MPSHGTGQPPRRGTAKRPATIGLLLNTIRDHGLISRAELAERLQLSRTTVSHLVDELLATGLIREVGVGISRGGRRPIMLRLHDAGYYVVGVDVGVHLLRVVLTNLAGERVGGTYTLPLEIDRGWQAGIAAARAAVEQQLDRCGIARGQVVGVGVGVPAPVEYTQGQIAVQPVLRTWQHVPLLKKLRDAFGLPVVLDNDANLGARGEWRHGAGSGFCSMAYVVVHTGIGGGLLFDGQVYRGPFGSVGEIGHITINEDGPYCRCGNRGCLESVAAIPPILATIRQALEAGRSSVLCVDDLTFTTLQHALQTNDPLACEVVRQAGVHLGVALANLANLFAPEVIVVGGEVVGAGSPLLHAAEQSMRERVLPMLADRVRVREAALGLDSIAVGAATLMLDTLFEGGAPPLLQAAARLLQTAGS